MKREVCITSQIEHHSKYNKSFISSNIRHPCPNKKRQPERMRPKKESKQMETLPQRESNIEFISDLLLQILTRNLGSQTYIIN